MRLQCKLDGCPYNYEFKYEKQFKEEQSKEGEPKWDPI